MQLTSRVKRMCAGQSPPLDQRLRRAINLRPVGDESGSNWLFNDLMLVFIDESGDPGFKVKDGSSPVFVAAMVIVHNKQDALRVENKVKEAQEKARAFPEVKFNKMTHRGRDEFFDTVRDMPFSVRAIVVQKEVIYSKKLKQDNEAFYNFFVRQMMQHDNETLNNAKVIIDGSGDREFRNTLKRFLRRQLGQRLRDVKFGRSESDSLIQLADMCAGAIARSYRSDRAHRLRWRRKLSRRIDDIWEFT